MLERLAAEAAERLVPGGWLLMETGPAVAAASEAALEQQPELVREPTLLDTAGLARVVRARRRS